MNPLFAQLALDWLQAEAEHNPSEWKDRPLGRDAMTVAVDRVYQVISGEVKWSEASPGDKAIWKSRIDDVPLFLRTWRRNGKAFPHTGEAVDELMRLARIPDGSNDPMNQTTPRPRAGGGEYVERTWWNYYDTWEDVGRKEASVRLFNNNNVGKPFLCNLVAGSQFPQDATFVVLAFYATVSTIDALHWGASRILVNFEIGNRHVAPQMFLRDLFRGIELVTPKARPLVIPVRQTFGARVDLKELPPKDLPSFDLTFHFEGLIIRNIS